MINIELNQKQAKLIVKVLKEAHADLESQEWWNETQRFDGEKYIPRPVIKTLENYISSQL